MTFETVKSEIENGERCPIETFFYFQNASLIFESLKKDSVCVQALQNALSKYSKKDKYVCNGLTIAFQNRKAVIFASDDPYLLDMELKRDGLTAKIANRKAFLKAQKEPFADDTTEGLILEGAKDVENITIIFKKA